MKLIATSLSLYAVIEFDQRHEVERINGACIFPCAVRTENGMPLPHPPRVIWERVVDDLPPGSEPVYRSLNDPYWLTEAKILYDFFPYTECKEIEDDKSGRFSHYNCDFRQYPCDASLYIGAYRCVVRFQHIRENEREFMISSTFGS